MYQVQQAWGTLWTINSAVASGANDRVTGITSTNFLGNNPIQVNPYFLRSMFALRITAIGTMTIASLRVYGAGNVNGFPPPGTPNEALWEYNGVPAFAANQGIIRIPMAKRIDGAFTAGASDQVFLLPPFLMLEYTTAGAAAQLTAIIEASFHGDLNDCQE